VLEMEPFRRSFGPNSGPSCTEPMTKPKSRIPPGSSYLIVDELGDREMKAGPPTHIHHQSWIVDSDKHFVGS
jgi:hypothetical protein